jgi:cysteine synthase A
MHDPILASLARSIGNTPLLRIRFRHAGRERDLYAKFEQHNLTGSIKDRMALHIITAAREAGQLRPGAVIVEATSGNTGISFAAIGRALGYRVRIYMPDWMSRERMDLIRSFGAEIVPVSREEGGFKGSIEMAEEYARAQPNSFLPRQFSNEANAEAHAVTTGQELWWQLGERGLAPAAFVAGVGTGGTVMGVARALRARRPVVKVHPVEPAESPTLSAGHKVGSHRIQGISDEFVPAIVKLQELDEVLAVHDGDAILMAQALAAELGLGVGISSGANLLAAFMAQERLGPGAVVATVFPDDNKKYLSTSLMSSEPAREDYLTPHIELLGYEVIRRACRTCSDLEICEHWPPRRREAEAGAELQVAAARAAATPPAAVTAGPARYPL